jgi:urease beta subunit
MNRATLLCACILFATVAVCTVTNEWVVRFDGTGPVKIGMSLSELNVALHESFSMPEDKDEQACFYVEHGKYPGVAFMIQEGHVTRVDVDRPGVSTAEGIKIGDSESRAIQVYGNKLKVDPHHYTAPEGHYLTVLSSNRRYGVRFETDEGKIVRFYAGQQQAIALVEGCQ